MFSLIQKFFLVKFEKSIQNRILKCFETNILYIMMSKASFQEPCDLTQVWNKLQAID